MTAIALVAVAGGMALSTLIEAAYRDADVSSLALSTVIVGGVGAALWRVTEVPTKLQRRDAFLAAVSVWLGISLAGAVAFRLTGLLPNWELAVFESISGFSGTGATVLSPIEGHGHGVLFFRQLTQWLGGMGMVVLAVAVLTYLGMGGMQLLSAEAPGPQVDRLAPRVSETAKRLWTLYLGLTVASALALLAVGVGPYDAVTHALTGISTGGFSPYDSSISHFDSVAVEVVVIAIMLVGGTNFALMWRVGRRRSLRPLFQVAEFQFYVGVIAAAVAVITVLLVVNDDLGFATALRGASFNVVAIMSTCGFGTADFVQWNAAAQLLLLFMMVSGGMAGSTSGGAKVFRIQVVLKHAARTIRQVQHPRGVFPVRLGDVAVTERIVSGVIAFLLLYFMIALVGIIALTMLGADLATAAGSIASAMGCIGPGLGETGPASNFLVLTAPQRLVMDLYMIFGRLEIIPVLIAARFLVAPLPNRRDVRWNMARLRG